MKQISFLALQKPSFDVNIITRAHLINKVKQIYSKYSLQFWKPEHHKAKIELI